MNGTDEYRNLRFKVLEFLVDGPMAVKFLTRPEKVTATIVNKLMSVEWVKHPRSVDKATGKVLQPCLEFECDFMKNRYIRSIASILKKALHSIVGDCCIMIEKPFGQEEEEPRAYLGMCRFDRIDIKLCPDLPPRLEEGATEEQRDIHRASVLVGGTPPHLMDAL